MTYTMKKLFIFPLLALLMGGCAKDDPFNSKGDVEEGQLLKSALGIELKADEIVKRKKMTRAVDFNANDFNVVICQSGSTVPFKTFKYGEMPDVITLPKGDYTCTATYGENTLAEWENPYFLGKSEVFTVNPYEITSYIAPIICKLENIKVSIVFDDELKSKMSADSHVLVKVGDNQGLTYTVEEADAAKAGYFKHTDETTLVATFEGSIDGQKIVETKSMKNIEKGNHYRITFKLHRHPGDDNTGDVDSDIQIDASVSVVDVERDIELPGDDLLDDKERPKEDDPTPGPGPDDPVVKAPEIVGVAPIDLDKVNHIDASVPVGITVNSYAAGGFEKFDVVIVSEQLTPEELTNVGLSDKLDLAETPENFAEPLSNFGFPTNVKGQKEAKIEISTFLLGMLKAVGQGYEHKFIITVTDANGTVEKTLNLFMD